MTEITAQSGLIHLETLYIKGKVGYWESVSVRQRLLPNLD